MDVSAFIPVTSLTQVSDTIGVVVMDVSDAFFGALVKAVDMVAQQHQKYVLIGNSYHEAEKERHAIEVLIRQRCNALIVHSKALSDRELAEFMVNCPARAGDCCGRKLGRHRFARYAGRRVRDGGTAGA